MNATGKRPIRRTGTRLNALIVLVLLLAACSSTVPTAAPASTQAPPAEPTQAPTAAPTTAPTTQPAAGLDCANVSGEVTVWIFAFPADVNSWKDVADGFSKKYPNIKLNVEAEHGSWDSWNAKKKAAIASKSGADVLMASNSEVYEWSVTKQILPLTPKLWSYEDAKKILWPGYILQSQVDNQVWGIGVPDVPGDAGLIANLDDLKEAGLERVDKFTNTEQMLQYADKLTERDGAAIARAGLSMRDESNFATYLYSYIADQGGQFWDNDTQKFDFNTPEAKAAMRLIVDLFQKQKVDDVKLPSALDGLFANRVAMAYTWPGFMWPGFMPSTLNMGFIMKPSFSGTKPAIFSHASTTVSGVIPAYTKNVDQAYCVVQYLASEEGQLLYLDASPGLSALRSLVLTNDFYETGKGAYLKPVIDGMKAGTMRYWGPWLDDPTLQLGILYPNILAMVNGKLTVDEGLKQLTDQMNKQVALSRQRVPEAPDTYIFFDKLPDELSTTSN
jgi:arabinogalactan oligomer/maltooligosaccharide transport system substrate-binding protein